jgi:superfamily II DNA/RNA helicase
LLLQTTTFAELGLSAKVQAAVQAAGYTEPTPIQRQAIPVAVTGCDVLGIAQTGTGKTAGYVLPMLARLESGRARARMPRSLILAPTRELAAQVEQSFEKYGINHRLSVALLIGGVSPDEQLRKLDRGADVLIATPGRLLDHFGRGKILLTGVEILVIDEADRMLDMGFIPDIERICKLLPPRRQTLFFSATMPPEIQRLVDTFLKDPVRIEVSRPATAATTITQLFRYCPSAEDYEKREVLRELIRSEHVKNAIIFCNRKRDVAILLKSLQKHGFNAGALHGDMDQMSRMATLDAFREGRITLLAASDVAARGLDIPDVSHIFNFDVPWQSDDYVHRIGRTGRAGKEGRSLTLVTPDDFRALRDIEKMLGAAVTWIGDAPSEEEIAEGSKKRRGRFGRGGRSSGRSETRSGSEGGRSRNGGDGGGRYRNGGSHHRGGRNGHGAAMRPHRPEREEAHSPGDNGNGHDQPEAMEPAVARTPRERPRHDRGGEQEPRRHREARHDAPERAARPPRGGEEQPRQPRGERRPQRGDRDRPEAKPQQQPRQSRPQRQPWEPRPPRSPDRGREDRGPSPVGLGDHVPAFLRKTTRTAN